MPHAAGRDGGIEHLVEEVAHLLPAQGPISIFIHHNTLHAFEDRPFEQAVLEAGRLFGCRPFLPEEAYREELARGRITEAELEEVVLSELGAHAPERLAAQLTRRDVAWVLARYGIAELRGPALRWTLEELDALERFRTDVPPAARAAVAAVRGPAGPDEGPWLRELWAECLAAIDRAGPATRPAAPRLYRHRDWLRLARGIDSDDDVHPLLVRFVAAYLDQGLALWPMAGRERGLWAAFVDCFRRPVARHFTTFSAALVELLEREGELSPLQAIEASLDALGVQRHERFNYLLETALALRGWAGMVRQIEERPDRVPVRPVPARLADFLAVRLLVERAVLARHAAGQPLAALREQLEAEVPPPASPSAGDRAWPLFQAAQLLGLDVVRVRRLAGPEVAALEAALAEYGSAFCRRVLHLAYELRLRRGFYDAVLQHTPASAPPPTVQLVTCIDEREESLRRHAEEVDPAIETFGTAGFFAVPMYFKGPRDARPRPLAPVAIRPRHYVELDAPPPSAMRRLGDRLESARAQTLHVGSRGLFRGLAVSVLGGLSLLPLVFRVLFPGRASRRGAQPEPQGGTLAIRRSDTPPPIGDHRGFTTDEMASSVERVLGDLGLGAARLAPLVLVLGHASDSLNNPHRSAYDCGACGGGPGGANARAFAMMANDPDVRAELERRGLAIPQGTWFVGGEHNTTDDSIAWFDAGLVPPALRGAFEHARAALDEARARNAAERCRRFDVAPLGPEAALRHVQARREDLAEPRPEYNHATNAVCVVGRRSRTRGLFFDRRAFLVSYDPLTDDEHGAILSRILSAAVPVLAGINLEYFFGAIDNEGYGAGTKLPHNVAALVGVMNGALGDLRTGLWAQTVEIHEPVRLTIVVEAAPDRVQRVLEASPALEQLVARRWLFLAALDPHGQSLWEWRGEGPVEVRPAAALMRVTGTSSTWFFGKRGHLPFVELRPT